MEEFKEINIYHSLDKLISKTFFLEHKDTLDNGLILTRPRSGADLNMMSV